MKKKSIIVAIICLLLTTAVVGHSQFSYAQEKGDRKKVKVVKEEGPKGHKTIGIDEDSLAVDSDKEFHLTFRTLMEWKYGEESNPPPPEKVKKLDGRKVRLMGFMYPLQEGTSIKYFCLLRTTQTCCYGPRPQYNQYVFVEMGKQTKFYRLNPVSCVGKLRVEPTPEEGYIFRMEGFNCEPIAR